MEKFHKYFDILNSFNDSIAILNHVGEIVFINTSWKQFSANNSGDPKKTGLGVNYLDTCKYAIGSDVQSAQEACKGIKKVIDKKIPYFEFEYPCHSPNKKRWFLLRTAPLQLFPEFTLVSHINITQRRLAEIEIRESSIQIQAINERLNSTIYKIVHDIQSPLSSIEGLISLTKIESKKNDLNTYFDLISKSVVNLKSYIQDTLKLSIQEPLYSPINFKLLISDFVESIQHSETMKNIRVEIDIEQELDFYCDKNELYSIVSNLISNCLKYYDNKKTDPFIVIHVVVSAADAIITIRDNGVGIKKEELPKIFELHFQSDKSSIIGAGIGLHMVEKSVAMLNGTVNVNSTYGKGTEFILKIPNNIILSKQ